MASKNLKPDSRKDKSAMDTSEKAFVSPRKPSIMEGRIEDTFYKDLRREWRSGSIAVMTDSFKNLPFVVST
ncbi:hypothetical protein ACROYT_G008882 [Oculina patagonica]